MEKQQHPATIFHDRLMLLAAFSLLSLGCISNKNISNDLNGRTFVSEGNLAYGGQDKFIFTDTSFAYYGTGPSHILSKGSWKYDVGYRQLDLKTKNEMKPVLIDGISVICVDLTDKTIAVLSKNKIWFNNLIYRKQHVHKNMLQRSL